MKPRELNPALKALFVAGFVFALFSASYNSRLSPEAWGHVAHGRELIKQMGMPDRNSYSFAGDMKWDYSTWVFDAFAYSFSSMAGADSLYLLKFFAMLLAFFALYLVMYKRQQGKYITMALPLGLYAAYLLEPHFAVMPQLLPLLFISYFLYVLERKPRTRNAALYYSLPFIAFLWSNMHLSALAAVVLMLVYLLYRFIETREEPEKKEVYDLRLYFTSLGGVFIAAFLNPSFLSGAAQFFGNLTAPEWFTGYAFTKRGLAASFPFFLFCGIMLLVMLYNMKGADVGRRAELIKDVLLYAVFLAAALKNSAYIPWFLVVSVPIAGYYTYLIFRWDFVWPRQWTEADLMKIKNAVYFVLVPLVFVYGGIKQGEKPADMFPSGAVAYIAGTQVPKNIFSEAGMAGYLEYYLYPEYKIMYDPAMKQPLQVEEDYNTIYYGDRTYGDEMVKYNLNTYILKFDAPALKYLNSAGFAAAYFDDKNIMMVNRLKTDRYFKAIRPLDEEFFSKANTQNALSELEPFSEDFPSERAQLMVAKIYAAGGKSRAIDYLSYMIDKFPENYKLYNYEGKLLYEAGDFENAADVLSSSRGRGPEEEAMLKDSKLKLKSK